MPDAVICVIARATFRSVNSVISQKSSPKELFVFPVNAISGLNVFGIYKSKTFFRYLQNWLGKSNFVSDSDILFSEEEACFLPLLYLL